MNTKSIKINTKLDNDIRLVPDEVEHLCAYTNPGF